ncbi:retrovirus-related Pol polyprotein from transposon TNT 1-94 [Andrographis paniculata]|uniref:retrovirus-related Pol polyprotein from transposon TNT 1-94 n=1 Tax=Andrographis paniculata TaxID=175694 RepID=UPI0021E8D106|nr:retrovirus-related Pol polyprotein from transposon TNT 1-94 [Andrographis paniculata]
MTQSMLKLQGMSDRFWAEGVVAATYILNLSPTKAVWNKIPYEAWSGYKPSNKLAEKSRKHIFIGYCTKSKAYRVYDPMDHKITVSRNVMFDEQATWDWTEKKISNTTSAMVEIELMEDDGPQILTPTKHDLTTPTESSLEESTVPNDPATLRRSTRGQIPRRRFEIEGEDASSLVLFAADPMTVEEAMEKAEWRNAMQEELSAIERNQTWKMKHKARLVAQGFTQQHGLDYEETFSPVAHFDTVRILLALAAQQQWKIYQFDVKSAFLNGDLQEEVYVSQPPGFENNEEKVLRLHKAFYGLKQAPRAWYNKIADFLQKVGFEKSPNEPTLYIKRRGTCDLLILSLYVDDMIYMSSSMHLINEFQTSMKKMFDMTDLGELQYFLGLEITQDRKGIFMTQRKYVEDTLKKSNMLGCNTVATPMNIGEKLTACDNTMLADATVYRSLVGRLIYLTHSRPDIAYSVGVLSRFMQKPTQHCLGAAKRVLRYLAGTKDFGIWFCKVEDFSLKGFTDSDWAGNLDDRRNTSENCFMLGTTAISWNSKKQPTVAVSKTSVAKTNPQWKRQFCCVLSLRLPRYDVVSLPHQTLRSIDSKDVKGLKSKREWVAELVSKNDDVVRSMPITVGGLSLLAVLVNRAVSGIAPVADASSSQSRADLLAIGLAVANILNGLVWLSIRPKPIATVSPIGVQCQRLYHELPEFVIAELLWTWESVSNVTCCRSLVVVYNSICILQAGFADVSRSNEGEPMVVDTDNLMKGSLYSGIVKSGSQSYLANLSLYPGKSELPFLPPNTQAVILQPIGDKGIAIVGGDTIRGFTTSDQAWINLIGEKLDTTLSKIVNEKPLRAEEKD